VQEESSPHRPIPIVWSASNPRVEVHREDGRVHVVAPLNTPAVRVIELARPDLTEAEYQRMWSAFGL
jgi:hypothetical protein